MKKNEENQFFTMNYYSHTKKDEEYWEGSWTISELKRYLRNIGVKFVCEYQYDNKYQFTINEKYVENLKRGSWNLFNTAEVHIYGIDTSDWYR